MKENFTVTNAINANKIQVRLVLLFIVNSDLEGLSTDFPGPLISYIINSIEAGRGQYNNESTAQLRHQIE